MTGDLIKTKPGQSHFPMISDFSTKLRAAISTKNVKNFHFSAQLLPMLKSVSAFSSPSNDRDRTKVNTTYLSKSTEIYLSILVYLHNGNFKINTTAEASIHMRSIEKMF